MAYKVFGNPITEETLKGMPEYANKSIITHVDKAHMAFNMKSTVEAQVREYMENLQKKMARPDRVHTFCKIYNATGDIVTFYTKHDYSGKLAEYSVYPVIIKNGQCGVFVHEGTKEMCTGKCTGLCGAVVYSGRNNDEEVCDWMMSWSNPISLENLYNKVYTEIAEHGHYKPYPEDPVWIEIHEKLHQSGSTSKYIWKGCESYMISTRISNSIVVVDALMVVN